MILGRFAESWGGFKIDLTTLRFKRHARACAISRVACELESSNIETKFNMGKSMVAQ